MANHTIKTLDQILHSRFKIIDSEISYLGEKVIKYFLTCLVAFVVFCFSYFLLNQLIISAISIYSSNIFVNYIIVLGLNISMLMIAYGAARKLFHQSTTIVSNIAKDALGSTEIHKTESAATTLLKNKHLMEIRRFYIEFRRMINNFIGINNLAVLAPIGVVIFFFLMSLKKLSIQKVFQYQFLLVYINKIIAYLKEAEINSRANINSGYVSNAEYTKATSNN